MFELPVDQSDESSQEHSEGHIWSRLNVILTLVVAFAALAIAYASYKQAEVSLAISERLAALEFARAAPDFDVEITGDQVGFGLQKKWQGDGVPDEVKIELSSGVMPGWSASGRIFIFLSQNNGFERCPLAIHGLYQQTTRGRLKLISKEAVSGLIKSLQDAGLKVEGFHTEFFIAGTTFDRQMEITNLSIDGDEYVARPFLEEPVIYSGEWSGGQGFYFDPEPTDSYCPPLRQSILSTIGLLSGRPGDDLRNAAPGVRLQLMQP